jgi:redox-sensing transcriptional repressor
MVLTTAGGICAGKRPMSPPATLFLRSQAVTVAVAGRFPARVPRCRPTASGARRSYGTAAVEQVDDRADEVAHRRVATGTGPTDAAEERRVSHPRPRIPEATVARLAVYLRVLTGLVDGGRSSVSSGELASAAGVNPAGLRKDLSHLGPCGVRGVGYDVATLRDRIARVLGVEESRACVLVGIGNLGTALADYAGFGSRGFRFVGLFDAAPSRIGQRIGGQPVRPMAELDEVVAAAGATIGVIATPAEVAPAVCDRLTAAGVRSILNFAPVALSAPLGVDVRQVDLSVELQVLAFLGQQREPAGVAAGAVEVLS